MNEELLRRILAEFGSAATGAYNQLARVPGTVAGAAGQALRLPQTLMERAGYAPHEVQSTMGQLAMLPQAPGMGTAAGTLPRLEGTGGAPGIINLAGPESRLGTSDELAQLLTGLRNMPGAQREALLRAPNRVTVRPSGNLPQNVYGYFRSNTPDALPGGTVQIAPKALPTTLAHEGGHALDVPFNALHNTPRSFAEPLMTHPAAQPVVRQLERMGYSEDRLARELFAMLHEATSPAPLTPDTLRTALAQAMQNPDFSRRAVDVLGASRAAIPKAP